MGNNINIISGDQDGGGRGTEIQSWPLPPGVENIQKPMFERSSTQLTTLTMFLYEIANESGPYSTD
jgi:hypothetical protein